MEGRTHIHSHSVKRDDFSVLFELGHGYPGAGAGGHGGVSSGGSPSKLFVSTHGAVRLLYTHTYTGMSCINFLKWEQWIFKYKILGKKADSDSQVILFT